MKPKAIDANVIIRFLTADHPVMSPRSRALFERVQRGEETVFLPEAALQDVIWTLGSHFGWTRQRIRSLVQLLLTFDHLRMRNKKRYWSALAIYEEKRVDFSDALIATEASEEELEEIYSYDKDFDRIASLGRVEP